ncbi:putative phage tail protein [Romboutsia sp. 1001285H_161024_C4]|uniref:putative phage tail protein n=1 Tax=Romboutsia sp. 1001285H_161024_C4 TaxID=2787109 RepID=UPI001FAB9A4E|nr:putative phage tail protein [Romboutsia sp. 1001285H_161024_C4]
MDKLPYFYDNLYIKPIQDSLDTEVKSMNKAVSDTLDQFFVEKATYGLDLWENMLGIKKNTLDIHTRRENIKAKMRTRGTSTISVIKNICEAYSNGEVEIEIDHANYFFWIIFVGSIGVPAAFEELDKTINDIKPAHLAHDYKFTYNNHNDLAKFTHEELSKFTHEELRTSQEIRGDNNG